ncbi:MAG: KAP family P-loop NTPase fold protein, partial [Candidatus Adiutrix sp.]
NEETIFSDEAIKNATHDDFNRQNFADKVANMLAQREPYDSTSIVVGICGEWGSGKSSVLNLMQETLAAKDNCIVIKFNPWYFTTQEQIIKSFFATLGQELENKLKGKFKWLMNKMGHIVNVAPDGLGFPINCIKWLFSLMIPKDIEEIRNEIGTSIKDQGKRIIVFIDDIDRLDKDEMFCMFKLVKQCADFPYVDYVLAFDREQVANAIGERFGLSAEEKKNGDAFSEKIVQVPLNLPLIPQDILWNFTLKKIKETLDFCDIQIEGKEFEMVFQQFKAFENSITTPRLAKRFVNSLRFTLPLIKDEINHGDFILLEAIRVFYPKLHKALHEEKSFLLLAQQQNNPHVFAQTSKARKEDDPGKALKELHQKQFTDLIEKGLPAGEESALEHLKSLVLYLFSGRKVHFGGASQTDSDCNKLSEQKRIASPLYFDRFFSLGIPLNDIS